MATAYTLSQTLLGLLRGALSDHDVLFGTLPEDVDGSQAPVVVAMVPGPVEASSDLTHIGVTQVKSYTWAVRVRVRARDAEEAFFLADEVLDAADAAVLGAFLDASCGPMVVAQGITFEDLTAGGYIFSMAWSHSRL